VGDQLRNLIVGSTIVPRRSLNEGQVDVSVRSYEFFETGGRYIRGVENVRSVGSYIISNDRLCVRLSSEQRCRIILAGNSGYRMVFLDRPNFLLNITINTERM
jgi:hypothetical protein